MITRMHMSSPCSTGWILFAGIGILSSTVKAKGHPRETFLRGNAKKDSIVNSASSWMDSSMSFGISDRNDSPH